MVKRKDGTHIDADDLTVADIASEAWDVLEYLDSEEEITGYLEGVLEEIEDGDSDPREFPFALADAINARAVNQLAEQTGADRLEISLMFAVPMPGGKNPKISADTIAKVAKAFGVEPPA